MGHDHHERHHHPPHDHRVAPGGQDWAEVGSFLELEAEVLVGCLDEAVSALTRLSSGAVQRIADVGCGPGAATAALARAFPEASLLALDRSPELLEMARSRALRLGVGARVTTRTGDLEALHDALKGTDLIWAGMVLHHLAELPRVLRELHGALSAGGLLAITEFGPPTRTLPDDLGFGAPDLPRRLLDARAAALEAHLPPGALTLDWPEVLRSAGFVLLENRTLHVDLPVPLSARAREWVRQGVRRSARTFDVELSDADRATLAVLADPDDDRGVMRRNDVEVHAGRAFFVARKS